MRQHHIRNRQQLIEDFGSYIVDDPHAAKGRWAELFGCDRPIKLEIGSGKGAFITGMCLRDPEVSFIACEGAYNVYPRIPQKAAALNVRNLLVLPNYITDPREFFEDGEISGIYLNFSDPWGKKRYNNRRLTYRDKIVGYSHICRPGSALEFKTDNDELFEFTLGELEHLGMVPEIVEYDLHNSPLAETNIPTQYEEKFTEQGLAIKYLRLLFT